MKAQVFEPTGDLKRDKWADFDEVNSQLCRVLLLDSQRFEPQDAELFQGYLDLFETIRVNTTNRGKTQVRVSERFLVLLDWAEGQRS